MKTVLLLIFFCSATACAKTQKNSQRTQPLDAIVNGTFATDAAMQEERTIQGDYIAEQEERYE
ncbi:MAG: hypothetical protein CMJ26_08440 [Phycisphaerae bacterium]|nr:hypothetical protein [Phycisphaerae bacterium]|tara:strand:- start:7146 stop:7334 length:189 start_codon:yes stop_codon:yes gene_type:complete